MRACVYVRAYLHACMRVCVRACVKSFVLKVREVIKGKFKLLTIVYNYRHIYDLVVTRACLCVVLVVVADV